TFTHAAGTEPAGDYTATIDWGDMTTSAGTVTQPGGPGTDYTVSGSHTYAEAGAFPIAVRVTEDAGAVDTGFVGVNSATIREPVFTFSNGSPLTGTEGDTFTNVTVGTFTHAGGTHPLPHFPPTIHPAHATTPP